ncbi:hypothetical protein B1H29_09055 [Streptomyces pactum]|uniref:Uncharacterized protein n=1 Tax=Streptomyces pactum TaxID=68249 RepID=A0A1S6J5Q2_9ACTN|nr:hypothetical protein B1H29_09055 [Streptomyces pactum]
MVRVSVRLHQLRRRVERQFGDDQAGLLILMTGVEIARWVRLAEIKVPTVPMTDPSNPAPVPIRARVTGVIVTA